MFQDPIFRISLVLSLSIHLMAFSPWHGLRFPNKEKEIKKEIEVFYLIPEEMPKDASLENIPQSYDLRKEEAKFKKNEKEQETILGTDDAANNIPEEVSENLEEYIQYYELIRQRIKNIIENKYSHYRERGEVAVLFKLDSHGRIEELNYIREKSLASERLIEAALISVKDAAPFPKFPEKLKRDALSFSIQIVFQK